MFDTRTIVQNRINGLIDATHETMYAETNDTVFAQPCRVSKSDETVSESILLNINTAFIAEYEQSFRDHIERLKQDRYKNDLQALQT